MQTYRRFVSYVYQYENGKKAGNRGFIKVEARGNTCSMQISLKGICRDGNGSCKVYGFKREEGLLKGSLLSVCPVKTGLVQEQMTFLRNEMGEAGYSLHDLSGVIFRGDDETMYGTQWDDAPMKMENFQPDEKNPRAEDLEKQERTGRETYVPDSSERSVPEEVLPQDAEAVAPERELPESNEIDDGPGRGSLQDIGADASYRAFPEGIRADGPETISQGGSAAGIPESVLLASVDTDIPDEGLTGNSEVDVSDGELPENVDVSDGELHMQEETVAPMMHESVMREKVQHEEREERKMPPKDSEISEVHGSGSGGISAEPPESGSTVGMPEPQEKEHMPESPGQPEEGGGLPDILDTTVPIPEPEGGIHQNMVEDNGMEESTMGEDTMGEGIMGEDIMEEDTMEDGSMESETAENDISGREMAGDGAVRISAAECAGGSVPDIKEERASFSPFTDGVLEDCRKISMGDLRFLDPRDQGMRSNRFVQHGYQMFGHLLLAKVSRNSQYILGVPGMYQKQEKFMADMHGFHNFKCAGRKGSRPACFGYWYRLIYPPKLDRRDERAH